MRCAICGKDCDEGFLNLGAYCRAGHRDEILRRHRQLLDELLQEDPGWMPETFALADFERFARKLAVHLLHGIGPAIWGQYRRRMPALLDPLEMALELKERILLSRPAEYVVLRQASGLARLFLGGTYSFRRPVPAPLLVEAVRQARLLPILGRGAVAAREGPTTTEQQDGNGLPDLGGQP